MNQRLLVFIVCMLAATATSAAAPQRTFVASTGNDAHPCSLTAPCRGFQAAINAVAASGEVVVLDSAGYGVMEIHKSVSIIVPPGVHAGLSPISGIPSPGFPGQSAVVLIDIQDTDTVVLRGLNLNHQGSVTGGIHWISANGGVVHIENAVINGFTNEGVFMMTKNGTMFIKDSNLRNNQFGIYARGSAVAHNFIIAEQVRVERSNWGVTLDGRSVVQLHESSLTNNQLGAYLFTTGGFAAEIYLDRCAISANSTGVKQNAVTNFDLTQITTVGSRFLNNVDVNQIGAGLNIVKSQGNNSGDLTFDISDPPK